ncbi:uncharacterized protein DSM5745_09470 [Aspergillus mulundensis]|uniref:Nucleotidyltransferase family protein n=1 Tax=Aspergillus mulundensis TaxID=1810919 RepID=A0A3D8QVL1_9EURO|nr:hypothetical protein DSM5745_09470 [Aspergillus mulundensis]RDW65731.1 hypothetical protein DSM5745_09470 [Aspergillus mulundensis]
MPVYLLESILQQSYQKSRVSSTIMDPERVSRKLATDVAFYLDEANIANVLFGWQGLILVGNRMVDGEVDFVIPDAQMPTAIKALESVGYLRCNEPDCVELNSDRMGPDEQNGYLVIKRNRCHRVAAAHFHFEAKQYLLSLHLQSSLLWWLSELTTANGPPAAVLEVGA